LNRGSRCGIGGGAIYRLVDIGGGGHIGGITEEGGCGRIDVRSGKGDTGGIVEGADGEGGIGGGLKSEEVDSHTMNTTD